MGKILTKYVWKLVPKNLILFNPCYMQLNHLIKGWWLIQRQNGSKDNTVRKNTRDIEKTCKDGTAELSKKSITSNVLSTENAPYPTANRGTERPSTPKGIIKLKTYNVVKF